MYQKIFILVFLVLGFLAAPAMAQESQNASEASESYSSFQSETALKNNNGKAPGWVSAVGIGYASSLGLNASLSGGYQFGLFGLYTDFAFKFGYKSPEFATDIAIVPKLQFGSRIVIFSLGLGLGYYYYKETMKVIDRYDRSAYSGDNQPEDHITTNAFLIKPLLELDFVLDNGFMFGIGIDVPIYIGSADKVSPRKYRLHLPDGSAPIFDKTHRSNENVHGARFGSRVFFGWKFM